MICWGIQHGEHMPMFLEMKQKGMSVPVLDSRPRLPAHLSVAYRAYNDLIHDGIILYRDFCFWVDRNHVGKVTEEYCWAVLNIALSEVSKWRKAKREREEALARGAQTKRGPY